MLEQAREGFVGLAKALAPAQVLDRARRRCTFAPQEPEDAEEGGKASRLAADPGVAHEERALARALAAVPAHVAPAGVGDVGAVELADPVIGQAGPALDRARARLVADEPQGQVESQAVARVAVVGDSHVDTLTVRNGTGSFTPVNPKPAPEPAKREMARLRGEMP